jgi:hypothetical protein
MKTAKPVLENPTILRAFAPIHVLFNILLSAYLYSNFNSLLTWLPAVFGIGTALYAWWQAGQIEQRDAKQQ